jgi:hypothetical protein
LSIGIYKARLRQRLGGKGDEDKAMDLIIFVRLKNLIIERDEI